MSTFKLPLIFITLLLSPLLLSACSSGPARFTIEAKDNLTFTPNTITVKAGQPVQLTLINQGALPHTFTAPDINIEVQMTPGETTFTVMPSDPTSRARDLEKATIPAFAA